MDRLEARLTGLGCVTTTASLFHRVFFRSLKLFCCATILFFSAGCERYGLDPGRSAPLIELKTLEGEPFELKSLRGKVVLINFWASWCGPCVEELPALRQFHNELAPEGVVVLGIGIDDTRENLLKKQSEYQLPFLTVQDLRGEAKTKYKVTGVPESFVVDRDGKLMMVVDPLSKEPVVKFTGPRPWARPEFIALFRAL